MVVSGPQQERKGTVKVPKVPPRSAFHVRFGAMGLEFGVLPLKSWTVLKLAIFQSPVLVVKIRYKPYANPTEILREKVEKFPSYTGLNT